MSFSITGNILTGASFRPDIVTFVHRTHGTANCQSTSTSKLNFAGYCPGVSTVTGLGRSLLGLVHTIAHLAIALFTLKKHHLREAGLGVQNFGRGLIEIVPLLGNLAMILNDTRREIKYEKIANDKAMALDKARTWGEEIGGQVAMFACGKLIISRPFREVSGSKTLGLIERAMNGHENGKVVGYPYLLPENQPWKNKEVRFH